MTAAECTLPTADLGGGSWRRRRKPADQRLEPPDVAASAGQMVLLAAAVASCVTVIAVLVLTAVAYGQATGSTDPNNPNIDPVFELRDKLVWAVGLGTAASLAVVLATVRRVQRRLLESQACQVAATTGALGVVVSAAWTDKNIGFSPSSLMLALVLIPVLVVAVGPRFSTFHGYGRPVVVVVGLALYVPALWQTPRGMYDAWNSARIIDELLGPAAGNLPASDYIAQYGGLLGLPLAPFRGLLTDHLDWWIMTYLSLLSILAVGALCTAAALMLPRGRRYLGGLFVVPVILMKPSAPDALTPDGVQRYFQMIPERSLLPAVVAVLLLGAVSRPASRQRWFWLGVVAGAAALNNVESGLPATVAVVLALLVRRGGWRCMGWFITGWAGLALAYLGLLLLTGGAFHVEYWVAFSLEFAGGFAALPMPVYGNYVLLLFVLVASVGSAVPVVWSKGSSASVASIGGLYFGSWGLMMFPYYVGRSSSLGQLQFFFIPCSVAAVWLFLGALAVLHSHGRSPRLAIPLLLCCLPCAVFVTAVVKAPSPTTNLARLTGDFGPFGMFRSTALRHPAVVDAKQGQALRALSVTMRKPVGLFFASGNVASLMTGLPNASLLAAPDELLPKRFWSGDPHDPGSARFRLLQCRSLEKSRFNSIIAQEFIAGGLRSCAGFARGPAQGGLVVLTRSR